jgi:enoyl-CoA hydratase
MSYVEVTDEAWGAKVVLNRPPVNALNTALLDELADALTAVAEKRPALAVLTATGRCFSAGADLKERHADAAAMWHRLQRGQRVLDVLRTVPFPTIAAIHGHCLGGAMNIVNNCDVRVARDDATFALPEVTVGRAGGASSLRGLAAEGTIRWLALTGEHVGADAAFRYGIVQKVIARADWEHDLDALLARVAGYGAEALRTVKEGWSRTQEMPSRDGQWLEQQLTYRRWLERNAGISHEPATATGPASAPTTAEPR